MHKKVQTKLFDEISSDSNNHQYLSMIINEVLRLFAPVTFINRKSSNDLILKNFKVPNGTTLSFPIYYYHCDEAIWGKNVMEFCPERFEKLSEEQKIAFMPFGSKFKNFIVK